ncbi:hypothetical protein ACHQM5_016438 [Ranunculus cassubicifolius]
MFSTKLQSSMSAATQSCLTKIQSKSPRMAVKMQANSCRAMDVALDKRPATNLYEVLRLKRPASNAQIKAAYRSLVKQFHPDTNKSGDDRDFIEIHEAYATLSDPITRARYDLNLALSLPDGVRQHPDFTNYCRTRRWESDQCW